ncbi:hypothetical protein TNIN_184911 [Trichonephila inaurata madagascariensis]|uniref:Uncharacterized protein n=1 Tax=Trichonephila inaurata madagascariensis TaxID=2747483 RepID=A0A8X6I2I2_9ARAC|nr:hypothetical protein TNIN_184911 [Trichonephila inaurata madagascariensis]
MNRPFLRPPSPGGCKLDYPRIRSAASRIRVLPDFQDGADFCCPVDDGHRSQTALFPMNEVLNGRSLNFHSPRFAGVLILVSGEEVLDERF